MSKKLKTKEKQFCFNYVNTGNVEESAIKAGYKSAPLLTGNKFFDRDDINLEIERLYNMKKKNFLYRACSGYERLAFGSIADAIRLIYSEDFDTKTIDEMDLFNVLEIKKLKDGAIEIKFFDRIRALEKLQQMDFAQQKQSFSFYDAIGKGAGAFNREIE
ncbi:MAG: hypothetical protein RUMPE_00864 [Eubacteriales bacterium SKADARSKE-1]|nr:hypothetical protein [Eubacteriales bacterium SKADARSKE-1]